MDELAKFKKLDCNRCGAPNWSRLHECPARGKKCAKCGKLGHYAKCCRTNQRVNRIHEHETSGAEDDNWSSNTIHSVNQKVHLTRQMKKNGLKFFTLFALVDNRPNNLIIDSGSPLSLILKSQLNRITPLKTVETEYRDVNDNGIRFEGKTIATVEISWKRNDLEILVTLKKTNHLLGLDWMVKSGITLDTGKTDPQTIHITEDADITIQKKVQETFQIYSKWKNN